ncbi:MAG: hypothetical protein JWO38_544 [Gemmataceae bacterium]|nr:hypothetical protein [Gemmataceae bacterium]
MPFAVSVVLALFALPTSAGAQPAGEIHAPKGGRFAVRLPGMPKEHTQSTRTDLGELKVYTATYATADGAVYLVSYTDFPPGAVKPDGRGPMYDAVREGIKGKDGKLVSEKEITVGPDQLPGREILVDKGRQQTRFRVVVRDHRLYQLAAVGPGEFVTGPAATAFFDSFEFAK